ncbi:MAG: Omp28 family outer membrane lipoprotein [Bacteroidales bacterium]|jgi:hypothetical protein|nr:Omp28 family outer membrane lipoprotein [Bacteroidales bacterium]
MNRYLKLFLGFLVFSSLIVSCDVIPEGEKTVIVENINAVRPVLLEDYTGQNCINCPRAAARATEIKKALGDNLIIVSIHTGIFSTRQFRTDAGQAYQEYFYPSNEAYPAGMIDRTVFDGDRVSTNDSKWGTYILKRAQELTLPKFELILSADYDPENKSFNVNVQGKGFEEIKNAKLQLWVTESHIIASQKAVGETIRDYEHNHVLRDAINGIWGSDVEINANTNYQFNYRSEAYSMASKDWIVENMHIVGFIYDSETQGVLYVKEIPLKNQ